MPDLLDRIEAIIRNDFPQVQRAGRLPKTGNALFRIGSGDNALRVEVTETVLEDGEAAAAGLLDSLPKYLKSLPAARALILTTDGIITAVDKR
jgi:hypothetical protein